MLGFGVGSGWLKLPLLLCLGVSVAADAAGEVGFTDGERKSIWCHEQQLQRICFDDNLKDILLQK